MNTPASITGSAVVGAQLTAHNGTWLYLDGSGCGSECVMSYQWQRCTGGCSDIPGATGRFYTVQAADAGHSLRALETMTSQDCGNINYSTGAQECRFVSKSAPSGHTAVVPGSAPTGPRRHLAAPAVPAPQAPLAPVATAAPRISGVRDRRGDADRLARKLDGLADAGSPVAALRRAGAELRRPRPQRRLLHADPVRRRQDAPRPDHRAQRSRCAPVEALSDATAVVSELKPTEEKPSLAAAKVLAPHRLVVGEVLARPKKLRAPATSPSRSASPTAAASGSPARSSPPPSFPATALVAPSAATTDEQGLVTPVFERGTKLYVKKPRPITLVLTARRPGDRATSPRAAVVRVQVAVAAKKR